MNIFMFFVTYKLNCDLQSLSAINKRKDLSVNLEMLMETSADSLSQSFGIIRLYISHQFFIIQYL